MLRVCGFAVTADEDAMRISAVSLRIGLGYYLRPDVVVRAKRSGRLPCDPVVDRAKKFTKYFPRQVAGALVKCVPRARLTPVCARPSSIFPNGKLLVMNAGTPEGCFMALHVRVPASRAGATGRAARLTRAPQTTFKTLRMDFPDIFVRPPPAEFPLSAHIVSELFVARAAGPAWGAWTPGGVKRWPPAVPVPPDGMVPLSVTVFTMLKLWLMKHAPQLFAELLRGLNDGVFVPHAVEGEI